MLIGSNRQKNLNYKVFNLYFVVDRQAKVSVAVYLGKYKDYDSNMFYIIMPVQSMYRLNKTQKQFYLNEFYFNTFFPVVFQEMLKHEPSEKMLLSIYAYVYEYDFQYDKDALNHWLTKALMGTKVFADVNIEDNMVLDASKKKAASKKYLSAKEVIPGGIYHTGYYDYWYLGKNPVDNQHYYARLGFDLPSSPYLNWLIKHPERIEKCANKKRCTANIEHKATYIEVPYDVFGELKRYENRFF